MAIIKFQNKQFNVDLRDDVDSSVANEIFKFQEYRAAEGAIRSAKFPILDIGAHIGLFSLYVRALNPLVQIVAFEPESNNFGRLEKTINENQINNIQLELLALATESGFKQFIVTPDSHNHHLLAASEPDNKLKTQKVRVVSLLDYCKKNKIKKIALIKFDVEGAEFELIESWSKNEFVLCQSILMEYHDSKERNHKKLINILGANGFGVQSFPSQFDGRMGFIFAKKRNK